MRAPSLSSRCVAMRELSSVFQSINRRYQDRHGVLRHLFKAFDGIRAAFAAPPKRKAGRLTASHFSFNSEHGQCATCEGLGYTTVEMQFVADNILPCPDCRGTRFKPEVSISSIEIETFTRYCNSASMRHMNSFAVEETIRERLTLLREIGLGYLPLGQSLSSLSAGRVDASQISLIAREIERRPKA